MAVTFDEARRIALDALAPDWPSHRGRFVVMPDGAEDAHAFSIRYGAAEWLVYGDERFMDWDTPAAFVRKRDGLLVVMPYVLALDILTSMRPVSSDQPPLTASSAGTRSP